MEYLQRGRDGLGALVLIGTFSLLLIVVACNSGRRNERIPGTGPDLGDCEDGFAFVTDISSNQACPGETILIEGVNFSPILEHNQVFFTGAGNVTSVPGLVLEFIDDGIHPIYDCPAATLVVQVPTGAPTGSVQVRVRMESGELQDAGGENFVACPEIVGFAAGVDGVPYLTVDSGFNFLTDEIQLYGLNLDTITGVVVTDPNGLTIPSATLTFGGVSNANYSLSNSWDVVTVELDPPGPIVPTCQSYYLEIALVDASSGTTQTSNTIIVPVREQFAPGEFAELPGTVTGCVVPNGVRRGVVPLSYRLAMDPAEARYDVIPEYQDPVTGGWIECSGVADDEGADRMAGVPDQSDEAALVGGGHLHVFRWDTVANGLEYDASIGGMPLTTRVRFRFGDPIPGSVQICPTFSQSGAHFETGRLVLDNPVGAGSDSESELVRIEFEGSLERDPATTAEWPSAGGVLTGADAGGPLPWASSTNDVWCAAESQFSPGFPGLYLIDTDTRTIIDVSNSSNPVTIQEPAFGDPAGVIAMRSFAIDASATVVVVGSAPLRIAVSGDGTDEFVALRIDGELRLDGDDATDAAGAVPGVGGGGAPGGGSGGDGGVVFIAASGDAASGDQLASRGGNQGGFPGQNATYARIGSSTSAKGGPGGGGGGGIAGGGGSFAWAGSVVAASPGAGGPARGDVALTERFGGSGGGGGGGSLFRSGTSGVLLSLAGGAGGGGGGAIEVLARGTIEVSGTVTANGGDGSNAAIVGVTQQHSGPGGGGSGGTIRLAATGDVRIGVEATIETRGGVGASTSSQVGGDGAPGRIRFEAAGQVLAVGVEDLSQIVPPVETALSISTGLTAAGSVDAGSGEDGPLDASQLPAGVYVIDTDAGTLRGPLSPSELPTTPTEPELRALADGAPLVADREGPVVWEFSRLEIPAGVTWRAIGAQPLLVRVVGECVLDGDGEHPTIDLSGFAGQPADVLSVPPVGGAGGRGGPGGSDGGVGGHVDAAGATHHGGNGSLSHLPPTFPVSPLEIGGGGGGSLPLMWIAPARGGFSREVETPIAAAGSGGGGGHVSVGGSAFVPSYAPLAPIGEGGSDYGTESFTDPATGDLLATGGAGGGGGGGHVSAFSGAAFDHAPGTGGGGGGGFLRLFVGGSLQVTSGASILARGGDAVRAPILGGNGGGGAGGGVHLRCAGVVHFTGVIDVSGGLPELDPDPAGGYTANSTSEAGAGSPGRIRIESGAGSLAVADLPFVPTPSVGGFWEATSDRSVAVTRPLAIGIDGAVRTVAAPLWETPRIRVVTPLAETPGFRVRYAGARESEDEPGRPGPFEGDVSDPALLGPVDYLRITWILYTNRETDDSVEIDAFELPYRY